ncbi:MAG UNVERIFIED_CONTAM: hypothetical protein LVT10_05585 [Anaerolineae bacterium]
MGKPLETEEDVRFVTGFADRCLRTSRRTLSRPCPCADEETVDSPACPSRKPPTRWGYAEEVAPNGEDSSTVIPVKAQNLAMSS